ncbi:MAG: hypothetical protein ACREOU_08270 [Candidatus Eiseniibacteriota bacterium]
MKHSDRHRTISGRPGPGALSLVLAFGLALAWGIGSAAAYTYGNLVVARGAVIEEYRVDGTRVGDLPVPYPGGIRTVENPLRDVAFDQEARVAVYNGAAHPWLSVYDPALRTWSHETLTGFSTSEIPGFGGLASSVSALVATDTGTLDGAENGLLRFNTPDITAKQRFASGFDFSDVATAPNGRIYALLAGLALIWIFDPVTLEAVDQLLLPNPFVAMTVGSNGDVYTVDGEGTIRRYDATATLVDAFPSGLPLPVDIDCSATGELVVGTSFGEILLTDLELDFVHIFFPGGGPAYVTWVPPHATTPATPLTWGSLKARYRR